MRRGGNNLYKLVCGRSKFKSEKQGDNVMAEECDGLTYECLVKSVYLVANKKNKLALL
jgi:hypothetical protein